MSGFRILNEAEHNGDRALAGRRTLTVGQSKAFVRRVGRHGISDDGEAGLYERLTNGEVDRILGMDGRYPICTSLV